MKNSVFIFVFALTALSIALNSCTGLKKMKKNQGLVTYQVNPNPLEMHADSVTINITGKFPEKYYKKKVVCEIKPFITYTGGETALKTVKVQGEKVLENNPVINYLGGGNFSYTDKVAYAENMRMSDLEVRISANVKKKFVDFDPIKLAKGTIATPGLLEKDAKAIIGKDKFQRITPENMVADIHYVINQATVRPAELNQQDFKDMRAYLKEAMKKDSRKDIKGVAVSSYASPDGALDLNAKLSDNRGSTGSTALKGDFAKFEKAKDKSFYSVIATPEDWDGFKTEMEKSDMADKDLILRVLSMYSDPIVREAEVKKLSKAYLQVADKILPKLRRSVLKVNVDVMGWSDEELNNHFDNNPSILKIEEILFAATLTQNLDRQLSIYQKASELFPNDWRTFNNAGVVLVQQGKTGEAKEQFEKAKAIESTNSIIMNNLGACALIDGDFVKAEEYFKSAGGAGKEVNYNLGICAVKKADYSSAVTYFGDYCTFNAGLAKLLNGDPNNCVKAVDCADDKERAMMYYLKAVAGARQQNTDLLYNNLRAAISKDSKLMEFAKTDMEFYKYFNDDTFKSIVK